MFREKNVFQKSYLLFSHDGSLNNVHDGLLCTCIFCMHLSNALNDCNIYNTHIPNKCIPVYAIKL